MKPTLKFLTLNLLVITGIIAFCGCAIIVPPIPPSKSETILARPAHSNTVWVHGHWRWSRFEHRYVWVPGAWRFKHVPRRVKFVR